MSFGSAISKNCVTLGRLFIHFHESVLIDYGVLRFGASNELVIASVHYHFCKNLVPCISQNLLFV